MAAPTRPDRRVRLTAESALLGALVGGLVVAPWLGSGYLLLLDWVSGPNQAVSSVVYGLTDRGADALPFRLATHALRGLIGPAALGVAVVWLFFPVAAATMSVLAGGGRWRRHAAALAFVCNPFVADRVRVGHVAFLLAVALLPALLHSALAARERGRWFSVRPAGWLALAASVSPHAAWLGGLTLGAVALLPRPRPRDLVRTLATIGCAAGVYVYAIVVWQAGGLAVEVTEADLDAYATRAGPGGPALTTLSLHGFWRAGGPLVRERYPGWLDLLLLAGVLALVAAGLVRTCRRTPTLGAPLVGLLVAGVLLGAGVGGPLGGSYRWLFAHVALFEVMREQQKWTALALLGMAVGLGAAVEALAARAWPAALAAAGAPLLAAPALLWGLGGSVPGAHYPASWYAADTLMGDGSGAVLFLPWHGYQPFGFTGERTVTTPAAAFFRRPVLAADNVELPGLRTDSVLARSAYLDRVLAAGGGADLGRALAPLGVAYVVLATEHERTAYAWVQRAAGLTEVLRTPELTVYRVTASGTGRVVGSRAATVDEVLAGAATMGTEAVLPAGAPTGPLPSTQSGRLYQLSPTVWRLDAGPPGWVVLPEPWSDGWRLEGRPGTPTTAGTIAFRAGPDPATIEYAPAGQMLFGLAATLLVLLALFGAGLATRRPRRRQPIPA